MILGLFRELCQVIIFSCLFYRHTTELLFDGGILAQVLEMQYLAGKSNVNNTDNEITGTVSRKDIRAGT